MRDYSHPPQKRSYQWYTLFPFARLPPEPGTERPYSLIIEQSLEMPHLRYQWDRRIIGTRIPCLISVMVMDVINITPDR